MGQDRRSHLVQCPVCCQQVAHSIINQHLDSNCQLLEKPTPNWGSLGQVRRRSTPLPVAPKSKSAKDPTTVRLSPFVECPVCNKTVARINIGDHLDKKCLLRQELTPSPTPVRQSSPVSTSTTFGISDALRPQPRSAFERKGKPPIAKSHIWIWRHHDNGVWTLDFKSVQNQAVNDDDDAACFEMMCDDRTAPVRVLVRLDCSGSPFDVNDPAAASNRNQTVSYRFPPSLLKSLLQKNVRLCRPWAAVRSALQLIRRCGLTECLRRFAVIMIEDAFLHPSLPWLMSLLIASSKGFLPPAHCISTVLTLVYEVAAVGTVDVVPESNPKLSMETDLESLGFQQHHCAVIRSILLRSSLGGMKCDVALLKNAAHLWANRFLDAGFAIAVDDPRFVIGPVKQLVNDDLHRIYIPSTVIIDVAAVENLDDDDLPLSVVDQHCSGVVPALLSLPEVRHHLPSSDCTAAELLQSVIWRCSSRLTNKQPFQSSGDAESPFVQQSLEELFDRIRDPMRAYATEFITQRRSVLKTPS